MFKCLQLPLGHTVYPHSRFLNLLFSDGLCPVGWNELVHVWDPAMTSHREKVIWLFNPLSIDGWVVSRGLFPSTLCGHEAWSMVTTLHVHNTPLYHTEPAEYKWSRKPSSLTTVDRSASIHHFIDQMKCFHLGIWLDDSRALMSHCFWRRIDFTVTLQIHWEIHI